MEWKFTEEGERVRVSIRTGRIIPKPVVERRDGIVPQQWKGERVCVCVLTGGGILFSHKFIPRVAESQRLKLAFVHFSTVCRLEN